MFARSITGSNLSYLQSATNSRTGLRISNSIPPGLRLFCLIFPLSLPPDEPLGRVERRFISPGEQNTTANTNSNPQPRHDLCSITWCFLVVLFVWRYPLVLVLLFLLSNPSVLPDPDQANRAASSAGALGTTRCILRRTVDVPRSGGQN